MNWSHFPRGESAIPNLIHLKVYRCEQLHSLPEPMNTFFPALQDLTIGDLPNLKSFAKFTGTIYRQGWMAIVECSCCYYWVRFGTSYLSFNVESSRWRYGECAHENGSAYSLFFCLFEMYMSQLDSYSLRFLHVPIWLLREAKLAQVHNLTFTQKRDRAKYIFSSYSFWDYTPRNNNSQSFIQASYFFWCNFITKPYYWKLKQVDCAVII